MLKPTKWLLGNEISLLSNEVAPRLARATVCVHAARWHERCSRGGVHERSHVPVPAPSLFGLHQPVRRSHAKPLPKHLVPGRRRTSARSVTSVLSVGPNDGVVRVPRRTAEFEWHLLHHLHCDRVVSMLHAGGHGVRNLGAGPTPPTDDHHKRVGRLVTVLGE